MIYTAAAGSTLLLFYSIVIDAGTNHKELLEDHLYLGNRQERVYGDAYYQFIDQFVQTAESLFPKLYLHWEDFAVQMLQRFWTNTNNQFQLLTMTSKERESLYWAVSSVH